MSLRRQFLNFWLKVVEKGRIRRATDPAPLRRALELQARLFFHPPRGTQKNWIKLGQIDALEMLPVHVADARKVLLYFHGGGFIFGSPRTHSAMLGQLAHRLGVRAVLPQYRLAPETPFPAAPEDIRAAWDALIAQGVKPREVVIGGDSAGGALAFGLVSDLCRTGQDLPAGVFGFSPLADLTYSGDSFRTNAAADVILPAENANRLSDMFLNGQPADDPRVSPLFGQFHTAPPAWITVGDTEILLDDARRLAALYREHESQATLVVRHDLPHVWPIFHNFLPEARETLDQLAAWVRQQPGWQGES